MLRNLISNLEEIFSEGLMGHFNCVLQCWLERLDEMGDPDHTVLWSMSHDVGDGYFCIRDVRNIEMNLDALHADEQGCYDGIPIGLWSWHEGNHQKWQMWAHEECK